jgi:hypothetical protein
MSEFLLPLLRQEDKPLFVVVLRVADVLDASWQLVQEIQYFTASLHPPLVLVWVQWGRVVGGGCSDD